MRASSAFRLEGLREGDHQVARTCHRARWTREHVVHLRGESLIKRGMAVGAASHHCWSLHVHCRWLWRCPPKLGPGRFRRKLRCLPPAMLLCAGSAAMSERVRFFCVSDAWQFTLFVCAFWSVLRSVELSSSVLHLGGGFMSCWGP